MPLKLNVGVSKKVGQPDYGSLGASCNVEVELDRWGNVGIDEQDGCILLHRDAQRNVYRVECLAVAGQCARYS